jgi:hypothetical protein
VIKDSRIEATGSVVATRGTARETEIEGSVMANGSVKISG